MNEPFGKPAFEDALALLREAVGTELRVALPGTIVTYDESTHLASVQPAFLRRSVGEVTPKKLPIVPNVTIIHPRTAQGAMILPVAVGDSVTLIVSDRDLSRWRNGSGGMAEPKTRRKHDMSDCWALLGGYPQGKPFTSPAPTGTLTLYMAPGTKIYVGNGSVELLSLLDQLLTSLLTLQVTGVQGGSSTLPVTPLNPADISTIQTALAALKSS